MSRRSPSMTRRRERRIAKSMLARGLVREPNKIGKKGHHIATAARDGRPQAPETTITVTGDGEGSRPLRVPLAEFLAPPEPSDVY